MNKCVLFLIACCSIGSSRLLGMDKKYDFYMERIYVSSLEQKNKEEKKSLEIKKEKIVPITKMLAFSKTGELFCHSFYNPTGKEGSSKIYDAKSYKLLMDGRYSGDSAVDSYLLRGGMEDDFLLLWGKRCHWGNLKEYWRYHYVHHSNEYNIVSAALSPSYNRIIDVRKSETGFCDKTTRANLRWYRGDAGKRTIWIGENYVATTPVSDSKITLYSMDYPTPKVIELDQGEGFLAQETCLSKDTKTMGIASTCDKENKKLTKIKLYDVESQKEKGYGFVPGIICNEKDGDMFFGNNDKSIVVHTKMPDGLNSYTIDVSSDEFRIIDTFKHPKSVKKLCQLVGGYFARISEKMVSICDMNNSRDVIDIVNLRVPTHVALDQNAPNKKAIIALENGSLYRYIESKNDEIKEEDEDVKLIDFNDFE